MDTTRKDAPSKGERSALTEADKRFIDFLVKQAIKQAMKSCT
jgi:hypothetical protein